MAIYRLEVKTISKEGKLSAIGAAAYRSGTVLRNQAGEVFDYGNKGAVLESFIMLPEGAPEWASNRELLWNSVEASETRANARYARELLVSLPHELNDQERTRLTREFVQKNCVVLGMAADVAIHGPHGDNKNYHAHIMVTDRRFEGDGFAAKKDRMWNHVQTLRKWRKNWELILNASMKTHNLELVTSEKKTRTRTNLPNHIHHMTRRGEFPNDLSLTYEDGRIKEKVIQDVKKKNFVAFLLEEGWMINAQKTTKRSASLKKGNRHLVTTLEEGVYKFFEVGKNRNHGTAIDFLMTEKSMNFQQACMWMATWEPKKEVFYIVDGGKSKKINYLNRWKKLPELGRSEFLEYRGLKSETYNAKIFQGKIKPFYEAVLFPHFQGEHLITGIEMRSRSTKKFWKNSRRGLWHSNTGDHSNPNKMLVIGESPIDVMSFGQYKGLAMDDSTVFVATSGSLAPEQIEMLTKVVKAHPWLLGIRLVCDNDKAGREMAKTLEDALRKETATTITTELPFLEGYDWNQMLTGGPIGYIREAKIVSKIFGTLTQDRKGRIIHGHKEDAIFLFQKREGGFLEAIEQAKKLGWQRIAVYGHSENAKAIQSLAQRQGLEVVIEHLPSQSLAMELPGSQTG